MYGRTLLLFVVIYLDPSALLQFNLRQVHLQLSTLGFVDAQGSYSSFLKHGVFRCNPTDIPLPIWSHSLSVPAQGNAL
jgi:hypothetical protein